MTNKKTNAEELAHKGLEQKVVKSKGAKPKVNEKNSHASGPHEGSHAVPAQTSAMSQTPSAEVVEELNDEERRSRERAAAHDEMERREKSRQEAHNRDLARAKSLRDELESWPREESQFTEDLKRSLIASLDRLSTSVSSGYDRLGGLTPALRWLLLEEGALDATYENQLYRNAVQEVASQFVDYEILLQSRLPQALLEDARVAAERTAYKQGTNALSDWPYFIRQTVKHRKSGASLVGVPTGLLRLDRALMGLLGLTVVLADRGRGKSTLAIQAAHHALMSCPGLCVLFLCLDMAKQVVYSRLLCREAKVTHRQLMGDDADQMSIREELQAASTRLQESSVLRRLRVVTSDDLEKRLLPEWDDERDQPCAPPAVGPILAQIASELVNENNASQVLFVVDLIQQIPVVSNEKHSLTAYCEHAHTSNQPDAIRRGANSFVSRAVTG